MTKNEDVTWIPKRHDLSKVDNITLMAELFQRGLTTIKSDEIPGWLVKEIHTATYGYKQVGDGTDFRDGYYMALQWVLSLRRRAENEITD